MFTLFGDINVALLVFILFTNSLFTPSSCCTVLWRYTLLSFFIITFLGLFPRILMCWCMKIFVKILHVAFLTFCFWWFFFFCALYHRISPEWFPTSFHTSRVSFKGFYDQTLFLLTLHFLFLPSFFVHSHLVFKLIILCLLVEKTSQSYDINQYEFHPRWKCCCVSSVTRLGETGEAVSCIGFSRIDDRFETIRKRSSHYLIDYLCEYGNWRYKLKKCKQEKQTANISHAVTLTWTPTKSFH